MGEDIIYLALVRGQPVGFFRDPTAANEWFDEGKIRNMVGRDIQVVRPTMFPI